MVDFVRFRRCRRTSAHRKLFFGHMLHPRDFILPIFVTLHHEQAGRSPYLDLHRFLPEELPRFLDPLYEKGLNSVLLFPVLPSDEKDEQGHVALTSKNPLFSAIRLLKQRYPNLLVFCDIALDPYTNHGHDGCLNALGEVDNDITVQKLSQLSLLCAEAGTDGVAPSDMMDGRVAMIRETLDERKFFDVLIMSYSAKFASSFYGPFRHVVNAGQEGQRKLDKKGYQLHPLSQFEPLSEIQQDQLEGSDLILIKPASFYLDLVVKALDIQDRPVGVYQVSGEYESLKIGSERGLWDFEAALWESFFCFKRAGASFIISYATPYVLMNWSDQEKFF